MKYAIFSDIHNNDHALSKMLHDAARRNIDAYLCLGDVGTAPTWPDNITTLQQFLKNRHRLGMAPVFPYYVQESDALWKTLAQLLDAKIPLLFHGHTHQQVAWILNTGNHLQKTRPDVLELDPQNTTIIGVGSVGQPKDSAKPSYVVFDPESRRVEFIRVG